RWDRPDGPWDGSAPCADPSPDGCAAAFPSEPSPASRSLIWPCGLTPLTRSCRPSAIMLSIYRVASSLQGGASPASFHRLPHRGAERGRRFGDRDPGRAHRLELGSGGALTARDDGAGMAHAAARWRRRARDEAHHRLLRLRLLVELGAVLLGRAADLADHDD